MQTAGDTNYTRNIKNNKDNIKDEVEISFITLRRPQIKMIRLPTENMDKIFIKNTIVRCMSDLMGGAAFDMIDAYIITVGGMTYTNCTLSCEIDTMEAILKRG